MLPQVPQIHDAQSSQLGDDALRVADPRPEPTLVPIALGKVSLLPGLFRDRRELTKAYALRLTTEDVFQNHLLEAGVRIDKPCETMHQGWEAPHCQLRGHFAGHWLSAISRFAAIDHSAILTGRATEALDVLARCQRLNQGGWIGSIPEKYFAILAAGNEPIWSPQYVLHKTLMGLVDAYSCLGNPMARELLSLAADWYLRWTDTLRAQGRAEAIYGGECAGMLELWAHLYGLTQDDRYLALARSYALPELFTRLLQGEDPLSHSHANASIPWIHGAARVYEVTGDPRYRRVVELFWQQAVERRGMFATTGNNAGEFWIPPGRFGHFLGSRTQEYCTVYNMIRVADYLFRWTGKSSYSDYIERALYNGILAQQNPKTGLVAYFLPVEPGAHKTWGTERQDFWCCYGTLVQAQASYEEWIYYVATDGITVSQYIPSQACVVVAGKTIRISQRFDDETSMHDGGTDGEVSHRVVELTIDGDGMTSWVLRLRQPNWALAPGRITVNGQPLSVTVSSNGFLELERDWSQARIRVSFPKRIAREPIPNQTRCFALLDGPVVLAALAEREPALLPNCSLTPQQEHQYVEGQDWQSGHYLGRTREGTVALKPLYEVVDERYCTYLSEAE